MVLAAAIAARRPSSSDSSGDVFEHGIGPQRRLRAQSRSLAKRMLASLTSLGRRRPGRDVVRREVEIVLEREGGADPPRSSGGGEAGAALDSPDTGRSVAGVQADLMAVAIEAARAAGREIAARLSRSATCV